MKLFLTPKAILGEISLMENAERNRREDRATVADFFNGAPPLTDEEAEEIGLSVNVNNLFGYTELADSRDQLLSLYTKPEQMFTVQLDDIPSPAERQMYEMEATTAFSELVKSSKRFKQAYNGACGDGSMHGEGVLFMPDTTGWCPSQTALSKLLIPDDAPTDITQLTHWAIESELRISDLHEHLRFKRDGWRLDSIRKILAEIYKQSNDNATSDAIDTMNVEDMEEKRQTNSSYGTNTRRRPMVKVYYFYQVRADKPGSPVDMMVLLHRTETVEARQTGEDENDKVLYKGDCAYESVREVLKPFFVDCILGGAPRWHRVLGLGHLNYQLNHAVELLLNRVMQGTLEGMMNLWKAKDSSTREEIQQLLVRHNGVVPENVDLIQQRYNADLGGSLSMIQFFRQQGSKNASGVMPNMGDAKLLEVQAAQQINFGNERTAMRMANWYDDLDDLGQTMFGRLMNPCILPEHPGYSDALKIQGRLTRLGLKLYYLQPHNVKVKAFRIIGDGDTNRARAGALFLTQNRQMFPPGAQREISRMATAVFTGSYELANRLIPLDKQRESDFEQAQNENNVAIVQGKPPRVKDEDVDEDHVPVHLEGMVGLIQRAAEFNKGAFTPQDFMGFRALGAHVVMHIQKREMMASGTDSRMNDGKKLARTWMQALNEIVSTGEKLARNMQQAEAGKQGEQINPMEIAKLQLDAEKLRLSRDKFEFSTEKWARQQELRESDTAFRQMMDTERLAGEQRLTKSKIVSTDVTTAKTIDEHRSGAPE